MKEKKLVFCLKGLLRVSLLLGLLLLAEPRVFAQNYSANSHGHSHNDYLRKQPFLEAAQFSFGSIEIDVILQNGELHVAHEKETIDPTRTIKSLYIDPLMKQLAEHNGKVYPDGGRLQLLVDLKTDAEPTLQALERLLKPIRKYFDLNNNPDGIRIVISGNMPDPIDFPKYDEIFYFDGRANIHYTTEQLERVPLFSAPLTQFTEWNGQEPISLEDLNKINAFVDSIHRLNKKIRFWGNPDTEFVWETFLKIGVNYINTDSPAVLASFLNDYKGRPYGSRSKVKEKLQ